MKTIIKIYTYIKDCIINILSTIFKKKKNGNEKNIHFEIKETKQNEIYLILKYIDDVYQIKTLILNELKNNMQFKVIYRLHSLLDNDNSVVLHGSVDPLLKRDNINDILNILEVSLYDQFKKYNIKHINMIEIIIKKVI